MGTYHRKQMKKLLGHADFAPVLASDVLTASASNVQAVASHTVAGSWVLPRDADIAGLVVMATGTLDAGQLDYAVTHDGTVAVSGALVGGVRSEATFAGLARANAAIASSGALLEIVYAVSSDLASEQDLRFSVDVDYIGKL